MIEFQSTDKEKISAVDQIASMVSADQDMRQRVSANNGMIETPEDDAVDLLNTAQMKKIVADIGWPSASKVGAETAHQAWLLVQHADHDLAWQKQCLELMREQPEGEVTLKDMAYLEDRIRVNEGRPQLYGTQFHQRQDGRLVVRPIEDPDGVDVRRRKAGMEPLADYVDEFLAIHQKK